MVNLDGLKRLTQELANEIKCEETGPALEFCKLILSSIKSPSVIINKDFKVVYLNDVAIKLGLKYGIDTTLGTKCYKARYNLDKPCKDCPLVKETREIQNIKWKSPHSGITYMITTIPLLYNGVSGVIKIFNKNGVINGRC